MFTFACEKMIRDSLKEVLGTVFSSGPKVIDEFGVMHGGARIDVAVVSDSFLYGYEIKSDYDTLCRLPNQVREYSPVFDEVSLIVGKNILLTQLILCLIGGGYALHCLIPIMR